MAPPVKICAEYPECFYLQQEDGGSPPAVQAEGQTTDTSDSATTPPQQTDHRRHLDILYRRLDHSTKCNPLVKYGKIFDQKNI